MVSDVWPVGMMQSNNIKPRRMLVPQRGTSKSLTFDVDRTSNAKKTQEDYSLSQRLKDCGQESKNLASGTGETPEDASITPPSEWGSTVNTHEGSFKPFENHNDQLRSFTADGNNATTALDILEPEHVLLAEGQKKVHFARQSDSRFYGNCYYVLLHFSSPFVFDN